MVSITLSRDFGHCKPTAKRDLLMAAKVEFPDGDSDLAIELDRLRREHMAPKKSGKGLQKGKGLEGVVTLTTKKR